MSNSSPVERRETWIDQVVRSTKNLEAPERYFWWAAVATIAAATRKNIYLSRGGHYNLYANIYVAILSKHSGLRKGLPVSFAARWLNAAQCTRVIEGRSSIQAVISEFSKQTTLETGGVISDAHGIMVSGEFDTMLLKDPEALTILTALYNTHEHAGKWKNTLKGSGVEELKDPCISLLVASNEVLFDDVVKSKDIEGGFLARTFIVHETKRRTINPLVDLDPDIIDNKKIVAGLKEIAQIKGPFVWSAEAKKHYVDWYTQLCNSTYEDPTGSMNRLGDSVLKVAMIINLAGRQDLVIHLDELELAISKSQECLSGVKEVTRSSGISDIAPATKRVLDRLLSAPAYTMQRRKLLQKIWPDVDALVLDKVLDTLTQTEALVSFKDTSNQVSYKLTDKAVEMFTRFVKD